MKKKEEKESACGCYEEIRKERIYLNHKRRKTLILVVYIFVKVILVERFSFVLGTRI